MMVSSNRLNQSHVDEAQASMKLYMPANPNSEAPVTSFVCTYSWDKIKRRAAIDFKGRLMDAAKKCLQLLLISDTNMC